MDTPTTGDVARELGVSIPRVHRAVEGGLVEADRDASGRLRLTRAALDELRCHWGAVPRIDGLTREQVLALAALSRRPLGLRSARALARAAGISPTTASRALRKLERAGYVERRSERVVEGRVRDVEVWTVRWGSGEWLSVASDVGWAVLPASAPRPAGRSVPQRLHHLFWNVDPAELDVVRDGRFVADRILRDGDTQGLAWMAVALPPEAIEAAAGGRGLDPRRATLARILAAA